MSKRLKRLAVVGALLGLGCGGSGSGSPGGSGSGGTAQLAGAGNGGTGTGGSPSGSSGSSAGGGGSGGSASGGTLNFGDSLAEGCIAYALAVCTRAVECDMLNPSPSPTAITSTCLEVTKDCPDLVASPGATRTPAGLKACAEVYKTLPCEQIQRDELPDCVTPGVRARGEPCTYASQCSSEICTGSNSTCGQCAVAVGVGESCSAGDVVCSDGSFCNEGTCFAYSSQVVALNEACTYESHCVPGAYCALSAGVDGVCQALPGAGQACTSGYECAAQSYCDQQTAICTAYPGLGQQCGVSNVFAPGGFFCAVGLVCSGADPERAELGTCVPLPQAGEPCIIPPDARVEGCADGLHCDFSATPATCSAPVKAGGACSYSFDCEAGLDCGCGVSPCDKRTCGALRYVGEPCSALDLTSHCHPALDCKDGSCKPGELRGVFAQACGTM